MEKSLTCTHALYVDHIVWLTKACRNKKEREKRKENGWTNNIEGKKCFLLTSQAVEHDRQMKNCVYCCAISSFFFLYFFPIFCFMHQIKRQPSWNDEHTIFAHTAFELLLVVVVVLVKTNRESEEEKNELSEITMNSGTFLSNVINTPKDH